MNIYEHCVFFGPLISQSLKLHGVWDSWKVSKLENKKHMFFGWMLKRGSKVQTIGTSKAFWTFENSKKSFLGENFWNFQNSNIHSEIETVKIVFLRCWPFKMRCLLDHSKIRRPESACSSNNLMQNPNHLQNPKSKIQDPKSKIQTAAFGAATKRVDTTTIQNPNPKSKIQNPKSKIQNPKSKIQNPKSKIQNPRSKIQNPNKIQTPKSKRLFWILDFGVWIWGGRAGAGGDGYVANALVWAGWPPEFGVAGGGLSL